MNDNNLISLADRTAKERKKIASKGGKASVEKKRHRKYIRECLEELLEGTITVDGLEVTRCEAIALTLVDKAINGDIRAMTIIRDMTEGKPTQKIAVEQIDQEAKAEIEKLLAEETEKLEAE